MKPYILVCCMLLAAFQLLSSSLEGIADDPGLGWHLQLGLEILQRQELPSQEFLVAGATGSPLVLSQWLSEVLIASIYSVGSWPQLYTIAFAVFFTTLWCLIFCASLVLSESFICALAGTYCAFILLQMHFILRPVLIQSTCVALAAILLFVAAQRIKIGTRIPAGQLLAIFGLFAFWANMHPSFVVGLLLTALLVPANLLDTLISKQPLSIRSLRDPACLSAAACLGSFCTPYGIGLHMSIASYMQLDYTQVQNEWLPPASGSIEHGALILMVLLLTCLILLARKSIRTIGTYPILVALPFLYASFSTVRYIPIATILVLYTASYLAHGILKQYAPRLLDSAACCSNLYRTSFITSALLLCAVSITTTHMNRVPFFAGTYGPSRSRFPYEAVTWLKLHTAPRSPAGMPAIVFNHPDWGGFLALNGYPAIQPVLDDRNFLFGKEYIEQAMRFFRSPRQSDLAPLLQPAPEYLLFPRQSPAGLWAAHKHSAAILYQDDTSVLLAADALLAAE